jgi:hypothetical protein
VIDDLPDSSVVAAEFGCVLTSRICDDPGACWTIGYCHRSRSPDPKRAARKQDVEAIRRKLLWERECYACGKPASDGHHVLFRSHGGDDVPENIAPLCHDDHMLLHFGSGEEREIVARQIGETLLAHDRDVIKYAIDKLGYWEGWDFLERIYYIHRPAKCDPED